MTELFARFKVGPCAVFGAGWLLLLAAALSSGCSGGGGGVPVFNQEPVAVNAAITVQEDTPLTIDLVPFASDGDGDGLTYVILNEPTHGTLTPAYRGR